MKNYIAALALGVLVAGCQQQENNASESPKPSEESKQTPEIADKDKMAYAIGVDMAESIRGINTEFKALTMDVEVVKRGFLDSLAGKAAITKEDVDQQRQIFQQKLRIAQQQKVEEAQAKLAAENKVYFDGLEAKGYQKTESGLFYKAVTPAKTGAAKPAKTDTVKVHYTGTFIDGKEFDSSVGKDPFQFSLNGGVIQGWLEGVALMGVGSKYQFVVPSNLAYGPRGRPGIPGGATLLFDIELLEIVEQKDSQ